MNLNYDHKIIKLLIKLVNINLSGYDKPAIIEFIVLSDLIKHESLLIRRHLQITCNCVNKSRYNRCIPQKQVEAMKEVG